MRGHPMCVDHLDGDVGGDGMASAAGRECLTHLSERRRSLSPVRRVTSAKEGQRVLHRRAELGRGRVLQGSRHRYVIAT